MNNVVIEKDKNNKRRFFVEDEWDKIEVLKLTDGTLEISFGPSYIPQISFDEFMKALQDIKDA